MTTQVKCPQCGKLFEPSEAFKHELEEKLLKEEQVKHREEIERLNKEKAELVEANVKELEEARRQIVEKANTEAQQGVIKELKDKEDQIVGLKKRAEQAEEQELKIRKEKRELEESKRKFEIEKQRQLDEEREKIRVEAVKETEDKTSLILAQEKKKNEDAQKQIMELQRKLQQGSQQLQGEVLELELEDLLKKEFPDDEIKEVKKGQRGADVIQAITDKRGQQCGTILWESKNAKWQEGWLKKFREDQREAKAQLGVLVATDLPEGIGLFKFKDGVWITSRKAVINLASALRFDLIHVNHERLMNIGKNEKMEVLYEYLTGTEFKHRVESIAEAFTNLQVDIEKEKRYFTIKWARQEKEIRKIIDSTHGMYGELQAVSGRALQPIKQLEPSNEER